MAKAHQRKCHACDNVAEHEDSVTPWVNCKKCGSQDTRLVKIPLADQEKQLLDGAVTSEVVEESFVVRLFVDGGGDVKRLCLSHERQRIAMKGQRKYIDEQNSKIAHLKDILHRVLQISPMPSKDDPWIPRELASEIIESVN